MQTVLEVLRKTTDWFLEKGLENARGDAEQLMAHGLGCKRLDLYLRFDKPLDETALTRLRPLMKRRAQREPLQHIIGTWSFFNLDLKVDARALIPRPETEELLDLLLSRPGEKPQRLLDLGTGTGAIALSLAQSLPQAEVYAVDLSEEALSLAEENAALNDLQRVHFLRGSWFDPVEGLFDWIVSNPPYLTEQEWAEAAPEVKNFDPYSALVAPDEGLADLQIILEGALAHLSGSGLVALETGIAHHSHLRELATALGYQNSESLKDSSGRDRFFIACK